MKNLFTWKTHFHVSLKHMRVACGLQNPATQVTGSSYFVITGFLDAPLLIEYRFTVVCCWNVDHMLISHKMYC